MFNTKEFAVKTLEAILDFQYRESAYFNGKMSNLSLSERNQLALAERIFTFLLPEGLKTTVKYEYVDSTQLKSLTVMDWSECT